MKPGIPWSVKGIEPEAREAAKIAARKAGMTLGAWLNQTIASAAETGAEAADSGAETGPAAKARLTELETLGANIGPIIDTLKEMAARIEEIDARQGAADEPGDSEANQALTALAARMELAEISAKTASARTNEAIEDLRRQTAELAEQLGPRGSATGAEDDTAEAITALEKALAALVDHIEKADARTTGRLAKTDNALAAIDKRLDELDLDSAIDGAIDGAIGARLEEVTAPVEKALRRIESRLETVEESNSHAIDNLDDRVETLSEEIAARPDATAQQRALGQALGEAVAQIQSSLDELGARIEEVRGEQSEALSETIAGLEDRWHRESENTLEAAKEAAREAAAETAREAVQEAAAKAAQEALEAAVSPVIDLEREAGETTRTEVGGLSHTVDQLSAGLAELAHETHEALTRLREDQDRLAAAGGSAEGDDNLWHDALHRLEDRLDAIAERVATTEHAAQEASQLRAVSYAARTAPDDDLFDEIKRKLENLSTRISSLEQRPADAQPEAAAGAFDEAIGDEPETPASFAELVDEAAAEAADETEELGETPEYIAADSFATAEAEIAEDAAPGGPLDQLKAALRQGGTTGETAEDSAEIEDEPVPLAADDPVRAAELAPSPFKRALSAIAALLLFAVAAVGAYEYMNGGLPFSTKGLLPDFLTIKQKPADPTAARTAPADKSAASPGAPSAAPAADSQSAAQSASPRSATDSQYDVETPPAPAPARQNLPLDEAAAAGNPAAQYELALRHEEGTGAPRDPAEAARWLEKAAENGVAVAQYKLGTFYETGKGVTRDRARASVWYKRAAAQGNLKAMHNLGVLSADSNGSSADFADAAHWFTKAAEAGLADSQFNLAVLFERGLGVERNTATAYKWFALAAVQGDEEARARAEALASTLSATELGRIDRAIAAWQPADLPAGANRAPTYAPAATP